MRKMEKLLPDDYPVYLTYWYVADGKPVRSPVEGTVRDLKRAISATDVGSCDAVGRDLPLT